MGQHASSVVADQVPSAVAMAAQFVTVAAMSNDVAQLTVDQTPFAAGGKRGFPIPS